MIILSTFLSSLGLGLTAQPKVIRWAKRKQHFDQTDSRKLHSGDISSLGGIGWIIATSCSSLVLGLVLGWDARFMPLFCSMALLFAVSLWDDLRPLSAGIRLLTQLLVTSSIYFVGWQLPLGWISYPATVIFLMAMINAFNFIDGINGLMACISTIAFMGFGFLFAHQGHTQWAVLCAAACGGLFAFLRYNFGRQAKIFMGDNGSTVIGLLLGVCFLQSLGINGFTLSRHNLWTALLVALPLVDLTRIVVLRLRQGHSPFHADRQHFHHLFVDHGWTAPSVCRLVIGFNGGLLFICWNLPYLLVQATLCVTAYLVLFKYANRQKRRLTIVPTQHVVEEKPVVFLESADELRA